VQGRPGDADERAHVAPEIVEVDVAQQRAVLVAVLEPADDRAGPLDGGGTESAQRAHGVGLHRQPGAEPAPPRVALDQLHLPRPAPQRQIQAQAGDPAADDQHPPRNHRSALPRHIPSALPRHIPRRDLRWAPP
jgi:hypothetical protein